MSGVAEQNFAMEGTAKISNGSVLGSRDQSAETRCGVRRDHWPCDGCSRLLTQEVIVLSEICVCVLASGIQLHVRSASVEVR